MFTRLLEAPSRLGLPPVCPLHRLVPVATEPAARSSLQLPAMPPAHVLNHWADSPRLAEKTPLLYFLCVKINPPFSTAHVHTFISLGATQVYLYTVGLAVRGSDGP